MPMIPAEQRAAAVLLLQEAERNQHIRIIAAHMSPAVETGRGYGVPEAAYDLKVAFVRPQEAYMGIDHELPIENAERMLPGGVVRMKAMDVRDAFAQASRNPTMMMQAALSLYADQITGEPIVRTPWPGQVASNLSNVGPQSRMMMAQASEMFADAALNQLRNAQAAPEAPEMPVEQAFFGAAPVPAVVAPDQGQPYFARLALTAMAIRATLPNGPLPQADRLEFPQAVLDRGVPSLRNLLTNPPDTEEVFRIAQTVRAHVVPLAQMNNRNVQGPFNANAPQAPEQREGLPQWAAAMNRGLQEVIRGAQPALAERPAADLALSAVINGNLTPIDAPRPRPALNGPIAENFRIG